MILIGALMACAQRPTLVFNKSQTVRAQVFRYQTPEDLRYPAAIIRGNNITVDFKGSIFEGAPQSAEPDQRKGLGILVDGKNITIKNLRVRGYKVALMAKGASGLKIIDSDFSYNWKQHLQSTLEREDLSDWMSYHQNEKDEWLRYGAGIYLRDCNNFEVRGTKIEGGQNGLMITGCNKGLIWNNSFSFLSGIGLGMYRSSENRIMHNNIDWCVRGFSYGKYNRGQDSAGILIYEQSSHNIFAYNSVTHGGDGFFLWAGQTTMDSGKGGCNDNLLFGNDFSHAPTNGIEATFSRNNFVNNLVLECWHGIWGGYGFESKVIGNFFGLNAEAIAWEHGQDNLIAHNNFYRDNEGIYLWSNPSQDPSWGYGKTRDTRSRDWKIQDNYFESEFTNALHFRRTSGITVTGNVLRNNGNLLKQEAEVTGLTMVPNTVVEGKPQPPASSLNQGEIGNLSDFLGRFSRAAILWRPMNHEAYAGWGGGSKEAQAQWEKYKAAVTPFAPKPLKGGHDPFLKPGTLRGWRYMMVDEWGPYDFKSPLLWPREVVAATSSTSLNPDGSQAKPTGRQYRKFEILGPKGTWRVVKAEGAILKEQRGQVPGEVEIGTDLYNPDTVNVELEYIGEQTTDYKGQVTPAGKAVRFGYSVFSAPIQWNVKFFKWSVPESSVEHANPKEDALQAIFKGTPIKEIKTDRLDYAGYAFDPATGNDHYATVAEGAFSIAPGTYTLELTTDDGARVWLDGKPLITDAWKYQGPTLYSREVKLGGQHTIRVEHFQIDGYAALKVNLRPKKT